MEELSSITKDNHEEIAQKYRLPIMEDECGNLYFDISNKADLENLVNTLTHKRCKDFDDNTVTIKAPYIKD